MQLLPISMLVKFWDTELQECQYRMNTGVFLGRVKLTDFSAWPTWGGAWTCQSPNTHDHVLFGFRWNSESSPVTVKEQHCSWLLSLEMIMHTVRPIDATESAGHSCQSGNKLSSTIYTYA